jgi:hypothetical protein
VVFEPNEFIEYCVDHVVFYIYWALFGSICFVVTTYDGASEWSDTSCVLK